MVRYAFELVILPIVDIAIGSQSIDLYNFDVNELQLYVDNLSLNEHEPSSSPPLTPYACPDDLALISHPTSDVHCFSTPIDSQDIPFVGVGWGYAFLGQQWPALDAELWDATTQQEHTWADSVINNFTCTPSDIYASSQSSPDSSSGYQTTSSKKSTTVKVRAFDLELQHKLSADADTSCRYSAVPAVRELLCATMILAVTSEATVASNRSRASGALRFVAHCHPPLRLDRC